MTIKRITSLLALSAAIAAVPAAAPSTFASISPTAAFADCHMDGLQVPCPGEGDGGGGDGGGDGNDDVHPGPCNGHFIGASARVCDFPIAPGTDVPPAFARPTSTVPIKIRSPGK